MLLLFAVSVSFSVSIVRSQFWGQIYKISYDLSQHYLKFIVRSTYDSDLERAKLFPIGISQVSLRTLSRRRSYDFASESYPRKTLRHSRDVL